MALLVMAVSNGGAEKIELSQHLMSQFSGGDDSTQSLSSSSGSGSHWYGHWSDSDSSADSQPNWMKQLKTMQARAAARRARENREFFSGVSKAFGKKSAKAMLAAFNGKGKNVLTKFKLNEKKLEAQKEKIADNKVVPSTSKKHAAHHKIQAKHAAKKDGKTSTEPKPADAKKPEPKSSDAKKAAPKSSDAKTSSEESKTADAKKAAAEKTAVKLAAKRIDHEAEAKKDAAAATKAALKVAKKMAEHKDPVAGAKKASHAAAAKGDAEKKAGATQQADVVKEALKIAKSMSEHKDPVYKPAVKKAAVSTSASTPAHAHTKPTVKSLQHQGILEASKKLMTLVHEVKNAHGKEKKVLKARVMELQQQMTADAAAVDTFGERAKTAFARAEAKEKGGKSGSKTSGKAHESHRDMSDAERLKADGWH